MSSDIPRLTVMGSVNDVVYDRISLYYMVQCYGRISPWPYTEKYRAFTLINESISVVRNGIQSSLTFYSKASSLNIATN